MFLIVLSPASGYHLTEEIIVFVAVTGQAWALKLSQQAGSTSLTSRVRGAVLMYPNEKIEYSDFTALERPFIRNSDSL